MIFKNLAIYLKLCLNSKPNEASFVWSEEESQLLNKTTIRVKINGKEQEFRQIIIRNNPTRHQSNEHEEYSCKNCHSITVLGAEENVDRRKLNDSLLPEFLQRHVLLIVFLHDLQYWNIQMCHLTFPRDKKIWKHVDFLNIQQNKFQQKFHKILHSNNNITSFDHKMVATHSVNHQS